MTNEQLYLTIGVPVVFNALTTMILVMVFNHRLNDLAVSINKRIDDLALSINKRIDDLNKRVDEMIGRRIV